MNKLLISIALLFLSLQLIGAENEKEGWVFYVSCFKKSEIRVVECKLLAKSPPLGDSISEVTWKINGKVHGKKFKFKNVSLPPGKHEIEAILLTKKGITLTDRETVIEDRSEAKIKFKWGDKHHSTMILLIENGELAGSSKTNDAGEEVFVPSSDITVQQWIDDGGESGAAATVGDFIEISKNRLKFKKIYNQMVSLTGTDSKGLKINIDLDISKK